MVPSAPVPGKETSGGGALAVLGQTVRGGCLGLVFAHVPDRSGDQVVDEMAAPEVPVGGVQIQDGDLSDFRVSVHPGGPEGVREVIVGPLPAVNPVWSRTAVRTS